MPPWPELIWTSWCPSSAEEKPTDRGWGEVAVTGAEESFAAAAVDAALAMTAVVGAETVATEAAHDETLKVSQFGVCFQTPHCHSSEAPLTDSEPDACLQVVLSYSLYYSSNYPWPILGVRWCNCMWRKKIREKREEKKSFKKKGWLVELPRPFSSHTHTHLALSGCRAFSLKLGRLCGGAPPRFTDAKERPEKSEG